MNREILFRGKRTDTGEWVEGDLARYKHGSVYISHSKTNMYTAYEVKSDTVGEFTGLTDANGMKIFEGDIVHIHDETFSWNEPYHEFDGLVFFQDGSFVVFDTDLVSHYSWIDFDVTILGNVYDNGERLKQLVVSNFKKR